MSAKVVPEALEVQGEEKGPAPVLRLEDVHAGYGKKEILHGVSLDLEPGEIVLLIGPNGAGKSTLLKVVAGLLQPSAGRVIFQGTDITKLATYHRARAGIAYLIQGGAVFPSLSVEDHLELGRAAARWGGRNTPHNDQGELLRVLRERSKLAAGLFSGGERQALAAAAILATQPVLLLADEPSAGLAPAAARQLLRAISNATRERHLPVLWVEQRVAEVLPLAHRAVLLRDGRIVAETVDPSEWLDGDTLSRLMFGEAT